MIPYNTIDKTAAGIAIFEFMTNLSFISAPTPLVAIMVVSEIMERLSPKYAPAMAAAPAIPAFSPAPWASAMATGIMVTCVPIEVPIHVEIIQQIRNIPGIRNCVGIRCIPRFTTESFPPITAVALAKPPARRTMIPINITPDAPAPLQ